MKFREDDMNLNRTNKISSHENSDEHCDTVDGKFKFCRKQSENIFKINFGVLL